MSTKFPWLACLVFALGGALVMFPAVTDAGKKRTETQEEKDQKIDDAKEAYMNDLVAAYRLQQLALADEKDPASAPSLIAAAAIFRRLSTVSLATIKEKPMIEQGKGDKTTDLVDKVEEAPDLLKLSETLLQKAKTLSDANKLKLDTAIERVQESKTRDVFGGPRQISRGIGGNQWQTYHIDVHPLRPVRFAFHSSFPMKVSVVRSDNDNPYANGVIENASTVFHPGPSSTGRVRLTIRVINISNRSGNYQMFVN
jgi:hypothetical protein